MLRTIRNGAAACLAYDLEEDKGARDSLVLVYQMGDNSLELSLVHVSNGLLRCVASSFTHDIGGYRFTDAVVDILCEEFQRKHRASPKANKRSMSKLKSQAEELKHVLSTMERAHCSIDALFDGQDFDYYLTRQRLEGACAKLYQQALEPVDQLLAKHGLSEANVDQVILCGGATQMCKLQSLVKQKFANARLLSQQSPDEIIAFGCAKQCALIKSSKVKTIGTDDVRFKCLSSPLYLQVEQQLVLLFNANTPLPLRKQLNVEFDLTRPTLRLVESEQKVIANVRNRLFDFVFLFEHMIAINVTMSVFADQSERVQDKGDRVPHSSQTVSLLIISFLLIFVLVFVVVGDVFSLISTFAHFRNETIEVTVSETAASSNKITLFLNSDSTVE